MKNKKKNPNNKPKTKGNCQSPSNDPSYPICWKVISVSSAWRISVVWTSQSKSNHCGLHYIPTCAEEDWHLLLTISREIFREESICQAHPGPTGWSTSKEAGISSLFNMKHSFLFKNLFPHLEKWFPQRKRWKAEWITAFREPSVPLSQQVTGDLSHVSFVLLL